MSEEDEVGVLLAANVLWLVRAMRYLRNSISTYLALNASKIPDPTA